MTKQEKFDWIETQWPSALGYGEYNTNLFGVFGRARDGEFYAIRLFAKSWQKKFLRVDEGLDLPRLSEARTEARELAKRAGIVEILPVPQ